MAPTKGFFSRRKYSEDELTPYLDPSSESQSLISRNDSSSFVGRTMAAKQQTARTASGGTVPMLATSSTKTAYSRATPVVTGGGGAAGLVFAPAMTRRNQSLPAIAYVKGPIRQSSAGASVSASTPNSALSHISTQATYDSANYTHQGHHMSTLSTDSTSPRTRKALLRSKSDANKLTSSLSRFTLRGKRKQPPAVLVEGGGPYSQSSSSSYQQRPSTTSSDAYSIQSSPPPTPPMKSPWTLAFSQPPSAGHTPLLQAPNILHQVSSVPSTPPHSPFPSRADAATPTMPAKTLASMQRAPPSTPPISPEDELRKMAATPVQGGGSGRKKTESELMVENSNLRRALATQNDILRRLDPHGMAMGSAHASTTTLSRTSTSSSASGMSETQRVNQVLSKRIRELEAALAQKSTQNNDRIHEQINDMRLSHAHMMEELRKAHATQLNSLRSTIDKIETRSPTPPPQLPPLNGLGIDVVDEGYSTPKPRREARLEDLNELRNQTDIIERLVTTQIMDFVEEAESAAQKGRSGQRSVQVTEQQQVSQASLESLQVELERERGMRKEAERKLADTVLRTQGELESALVDQENMRNSERQRQFQEIQDALMQERHMRESLHQEYIKSRQALDALNSEYDIVRLQNDTLVQQNNLLNQQINTHKQQSPHVGPHSPSEDLMRLKGAYEQVVQQLMNTQAELEDYRAAEHAYAADAQEQQNKIIEMEEDLKNYKEKVGHLINQLADASNHGAGILEDLRRERKKTRELERNAKQQAQASSASEGEQSQSRHISALNAELKKTTQKKENLQNRLAATEMALKRKQEQLDGLIARETMPNPEIAGRVSALSDENLQLRARLRSIEEDLSRAHDESKLFKRRLEQFMGQQSVVLGDLQQQVSSARKEKQQVERRLHRLQKGWEDRKDPMLEEQKAAARKLKDKPQPLPPVVTNVPLPAEEEEDMIIVW